MLFFNTSTVLRLLPLPLTLIIYCIFTAIRGDNGELHYDLSQSIDIVLPPFNSTEGAITTKSFNLTETKSNFSPAAYSFWKDFVVALENERPRCSPVQVEEDHLTSSGPPFEDLNTTNPPPRRLVDFNDEHEATSFRERYLMPTSMQRHASRLIFVKGEQGFVTTANARHLSVLLVSLRMLRKTGCQLPVEVFIKDWTEYDPVVCETVLPPLNAACVVLSEIHGTVSNIQKPTSYQFKIFAILFSSFEHVFFFDSDTFPAHNPTNLFSTPPYTTHGLVVWPGIFGPKISEQPHHITATAYEPRLSPVPTESNIIMLDKEKHRESLLMMVYYNFYGVEYYAPLPCRGLQGSGDRKTFVEAAVTVGASWYQVKADVVRLGHFKDGGYRLSGVVQMDPRNDYHYQLLSQSNIRAGDSWQTADLKDEGIIATRPKPLFVQQNMHKLDPTWILSTDRTTAKKKDSNYTRIWGDLEEIIRIFGYDIEKQVWEAIVEEGCRGRVGKEREDCENLKGYFTQVFGVLEEVKEI